MRTPFFKDLRSVDQKWSPERSTGAPEAGWCWEDIAQKASDWFGLMHVDTGEYIAVWSSKGLLRNMSIGDMRRQYYLDRVEVHPRWRGRSIGKVAAACVAKRAFELDADSVIFQAFPSACCFWFEKVGAGELGDEIHRIWQVENGLVPMILDRDIMIDLQRFFDGSVLYQTREST